MLLCWTFLMPGAKPPKKEVKGPGERPTRTTDRYWVPIVSRTLDLLDCFYLDTDALTLQEIVRATSIPHTSAFRILHTLVARGYLLQSGKTYRLNRARKRLKIGFANLSKKIDLAREIQASTERAAGEYRVDLRVWDNNRDADMAIRNANEMVASAINVAIEFQLFEQVAPVIHDIFAHAKIPVISIVNPHHGTLYYGVNNYRAGFAAGQALAAYATERWKGRLDALILLGAPQGGRTVQSRLVGVQKGVEERLGILDSGVVHDLDYGGDRAASEAAVRKFMTGRRMKRVLIAGINDESALGAARAAEDLRAKTEFAIVGHGGSREILQAVHDPLSPCIGTVSFRGEQYGPGLIAFALAVAAGRAAGPVQYVAFEFIGKNAALAAD
jgi:ribose transport system substrate-binding protein